MIGFKDISKEMKANIHVHIGLEKTGSTSIQRYFYKNRGALLRNGILYPSSLGKQNHTKLAIVLPDDKKVDFLRRRAGVTEPEQIKNTLKEIKNKFGAEVAKHSPKTIVISNEHLSSRLNTIEEIERLKSFLLPFAQTINLYVYLRPQEQLILSRYSTYIKCGGIKRFHEYLEMPKPAFLSYGTLLEKWEQVFGTNFFVGIFDQNTLKERNIVADFISQLAISRKQIPEPESIVTNTSLSLTTLEKLHKIFRWLPILQRPSMSIVRKKIINYLDKSGDALNMDGSEITMIQLQFESENRAVAQRYFQRDLLFNNETIANQR